MTVIVHASSGRELTHQSTSATARWGGSDWIVPSTADLNASDEGLSGAPLNEATVTTSNLDVTIDTFEAFLGGAWVASDDSTAAEHTHTLPGNSTTTTLFLGYDYSSTDTIIFGPAGDFAADDPKVPVANVTDDGTSVTNTTDRRPVGRAPHRGVLVDSVYDTDTSTTLDIDTGTLGTTYDQYDVVIYREGHGASETYQKLRVNNISSTNYYGDLYDSLNNTFTSYDGVGAWRKIAGVKDSETQLAAQVVRISCPREVVPTGNHHPIINTQELGLGKNLDYTLEGHLAVDIPRVDQVALFDGGNATGWVEIYGQSFGTGGAAWY